jgi:hypothetical protein
MTWRSHIEIVFPWHFRQHNTWFSFMPPPPQNVYLERCKFHHAKYLTLWPSSIYSRPYVVSDTPDAPDTKLGLFADDAAVVERGSSCWNFSYPHHFWYSGLWNGVSINPEKAVAILLTRYPDRPLPELKLISHWISWSRKLKYLGTT